MGKNITNQDVKILFNDDNLMIVKPLSRKGFIYYGYPSDWVPDLNLSEYHRERVDDIISQNEEMYFIIDKKNQRKWGILKDSYGYTVEDFDNNDISDETKKEIRALQTYENKRFINDILGKSTFKILRKFLSGKATAGQLENIDDLIYEVDRNPDDLNESVVILEKEKDDEFLGLTEMTEESKWFINGILSSREWEFTDMSREWDDLMQGYGVFRYFSDENISKLKIIGQYLLPNEEFDMDSEKYMKNLASEFDKHFERQLSEILYRYISAINESSTEYAEETVEKEVAEFFGKYGLTFTHKYSIIKTTAGNLMRIYLESFRPTDNLETLLSNIFQKDRDYPDYENWYEFQDSAKVDWEYLNVKFSEELDEVLEKIEEDEDFKKRFEVIKNLESKHYNFNVIYSTRFEPKINFKIEMVDEDAKIVVKLFKPDSKYLGKSITHKFTEENFYKFINNPEIFSIFDR